jgi:hypothetical protein
MIVCNGCGRLLPNRLGVPCDPCSRVMVDGEGTFYWVYYCNDGCYQVHQLIQHHRPLPIPWNTLQEKCLG